MGMGLNEVFVRPAGEPVPEIVDFYLPRGVILPRRCVPMRKQYPGNGRR